MKSCNFRQLTILKTCSLCNPQKGSRFHSCNFSNYKVPRIMNLTNQPSFYCERALLRATNQAALPNEL